MDTSQQELDRTNLQEKMRCPSCGGLNRVGADWCGQCLRRFTAPPPPAAAPVSEEAPEAPAVAEAPPAAEPASAPVEDPQAISAYAAYIDDDLAGQDVNGSNGNGTSETAGVAPPGTQPAKAPPAELVGKKRGAFKVTAEGIVWTCKSCDTENPLALQVCSVCGTQFANTLRDEKATRIERDPGTVAMVSLFMPGAGHAYMGMWGQAIARGILQLWVLFTALMGALQKGGSNVIVMVFGFAALVFWMLSAHDAYREASHEPKAVILKGRMFMYVVLGLLMLLIVLLMGAGLKAR